MCVYECLCLLQLSAASRNPAADIDWNLFLRDTSDFVSNSLGLLDNLAPLLNLVDGGSGVEQLYQGVASVAARISDVSSVDDLIA